MPHDQEWHDRDRHDVDREPSGRQPRLPRPRDAGAAQSRGCARCAARMKGHSAPAAGHEPAGRAGLLRQRRPTTPTARPIIRKFVDSLPGLGAAANEQPRAVHPGRRAGHDHLSRAPTTTRSPCVSTPRRCTRDLPADHAARLRAAQQRHRSDRPQHASRRRRSSYLGPLIVAQKDRPVRVKFTNELPTGQPAATSSSRSTRRSWAPAPARNGGTEMYTQNRAAIHLHGGDTPWISDGTPHQWITPGRRDDLLPEGRQRRRTSRTCGSTPTATLVPAGHRRAPPTTRARAP